MLAQFKSLFSNDIGIDLGTANSLVYVRDRGIVLRDLQALNRLQFRVRRSFRRAATALAKRRQIWLHSECGVTRVLACAYDATSRQCEETL